MGEVLRDYEMVVLYHPDLEMDLDKPLKKIEGIITAQKGKVNKTDSWGKRKLTYQIKKQDYGVYVYYEVSLPAVAVAKVEGALNIANEVIRYLITNPVPVVEEDEKEEGDDKKETKKKEVKKDEDKKAGKDAKADEKSADDEKATKK